MGKRQRELRTMGRRKIDIAYLTDDRVRKVTFCKRKGGLFKKADDLSKLCGVEVAVMIVAENKTQHFATSDLERIVTKFQALNSGQPLSEESETDRLWKKLENQRREIEGLQRQLADERKKVEALVGGELQMLAVHPHQPALVNTTTALPISAGMVQAVPSVSQPLTMPVVLPPAPSQDVVVVADQEQRAMMSLGSVAQAGQTEMALQTAPPTSQDTDSLTEPAAKRSKVEAT